jgi:hypothetical protein
VANNDRIVFMGTLSTKARKELPDSDFGLPAERKYPEENRGHARDAEGRARQMLKRGAISQAQYDKIVAKAKRKLAK